LIAKYKIQWSSKPRIGVAAWKPRQVKYFCLEPSLVVLLFSRRYSMIATTIRFILPNGTDWNAMSELMKQRAALYHNVRGLRSKAFVLNPETREYGGNYVWDDREAFNAFRDSELYLSAVKKLGEPREVKIYEVPAYVDNASVPA
jgi:heme-degrading monooxygenase HmoA